MSLLLICFWFCGAGEDGLGGFEVDDGGATSTGLFSL
jgi:hypothetical protein